MIAQQFTAPANIEVSGADFRCTVTGTLTGSKFILEIQTNSSDQPTGTVVGSGSVGAFFTSSGFFGYIQQFQATASLNRNQLYWLVMRQATGEDCTDTNYVTPTTYGGSSNNAVGGRLRKYSGSLNTWTASSSQNYSGTWVLEYNGGHVGQGMNLQAASGPSLYGNTAQGLKFRVKNRQYTDGFMIAGTFVGSPAGDFKANFYKNNQLIQSWSLSLGNIPNVNGGARYYNLSSSYLLEPGNDYFVYGYQANNTGSSANYYRISRTQPHSVWGFLERPDLWTDVTASIANNPTTNYYTRSYDIPYILPFSRNVTEGFAFPTVSG
jgi:hypothetical protein